MSYVALDIRNPEKCVKATYPSSTRLEIIYEVLDPKKDQIKMGMKSPEGPLAQGKVFFTIGPEPRDHGRNSDIMKHDVKQTEGKIKYQGSSGGYVSVCVTIEESPGRKYVKPALIAFRISEAGEEAPAEESPDVKTQDAAKAHLNEMEKILSKMIGTTSLLKRNAEEIKSDEASFQRQSAEMNSASRWWPMIHIVVLLSTGFTQANHVVKFFKSRHII